MCRQSRLADAGPVRNLQNQNTERLVPGVTIFNNVIARSGSGGIHFSGDPATVNTQSGPSPFGRIVNNTIYGRQSNDTGILVNENASPTIMNNIVANSNIGILVDPSSNTTVLGETLYQSNNQNTDGTGFQLILSIFGIFCRNYFSNSYACFLIFYIFHIICFR